MPIFETNNFSDDCLLLSSSPAGYSCINKDTGNVTYYDCIEQKEYVLAESYSNGLTCISHEDVINGTQFDCVISGGAWEDADATSGDTTALVDITETGSVSDLAEFDSVEYANITDDSSLTYSDSVDFGTISIELEEDSFIDFGFSCSQNQYVTLTENKLTCVDFPRKETQMFTVDTIIIVALIAFIVVKLEPLLTLKRFFKAIIRFVFKPLKKAESKVDSAWKEALKDEGI